MGRPACNRLAEHSFRFGSRIATVHINETQPSRARDELLKLCARARFSRVFDARRRALPGAPRSFAARADGGAMGAAWLESSSLLW